MRIHIWGAIKMRKTLWSTLFILLLIIIVVVNPTEGRGPDHDIVQVSISHSLGQFLINPNFFAVYKTNPILDVFNEAITTAEMLPGVLDINAPLFGFEVMYKDGNKEQYFLWMYENYANSGLMNASNTHRLSLISEESTALLKMILANYLDW